MSKKKHKQNTVSNYQRHIAAGQSQSWLDRMADWIGGRSRLIRALIAAGIALVLTVGIALVIYAGLFNADPNRLNFGPINAYNLPLVMVIILSGVGFAFYWVGWRVMIGFNFEETPLQPGIPAAVWLLLGIVVLILVLLLGFLTLINALQS